MTSFALEPIYGSLLFALVAAATTVAVILWVTPPTENQSQRRWLITLRLLAGAILLLSLLRPALLRTDNRPADATLVVAVDTSRSMTLPDGAGGERWATQVETWRRLAEGVIGIDESLDIQLIAYDSKSRKLAAATPDALSALTPDGELTDLSAAALSTIQAAEGQPIAGVVFMGDGTQTAPLKGSGAQRVIETLNSLGVPLWTVPIGPPGGQSASRDAAIDSLPESFQLFAGNEVTIPFQLVTRGLAGIDVPLRLRWVDLEGKETEFATRNVAPTNSSQSTAMTIPVVAPAPGTYRLIVQADTQEGELVTTNNVQTAFVDVREGGGRILYLEGTPRLEQTFLRRSLRRFQDLDLTYRWVPSDTVNRWPVNLDDWFRPGKFDIYIIGDLDSAAIGKQQLAELADSVSKGAGLIAIGGQQSFGGGGYAVSPLADVLPIKMNPSLRRSVGAINRLDEAHLAGPLPIRLVRNHPITELGGQDPSTIWNQLPPLQGANRLVGPKVAPGVQTLLESGNQDPLLVVGEYGRGRTAAFAADSTWRWWRAGQSDAHRRFWRQLVLWLLAREETSGDKIQIDMDARRFAVTDPPQFRAIIQSVGDASSPVDLVAEMVDDKGTVVSIPTSVQSESEQSSGSGGMSIRGQLPKSAAGFYRLRVRPKQPSESLKAEEMAFQVVDESRELAQPMADPIYLRQLAELTVEQGGAAFEPDEIDELIDTIRKRRRQAETPVVEKFRLGDGPLSGWILFALFAGTLSTEWFLRRQWGLA